MPKYEVQMQKTDRYFVTVTIEAEDETAAENEATTLGYEDKVDWQWDDSEIDAIEIDEVEDAEAVKEAAKG